ncbi:unannotated protein [freshwater metagenome]|uniref:Unannotated protein n=1 Tax=freshwater metagenome TaxID=449393 RepID=A0A6J6LF41_9ZZZZ|nr:hypothetical protein [Actinomycetota bacterium]
MRVGSTTILRVFTAAGLTLLLACGEVSESTVSSYSTYPSSNIVDASPPTTEAPATTVDVASLEIDQNACFNSIAIVQSNADGVQAAVDNFDMFGNPYASVFAKLQQQLASIANNASFRVSGEINAMSDLMGSLYEAVLYQDDYGYDFAVQQSSSISSNLMRSCGDIGATCPDGSDIAARNYNCE